MHRHPRTACVKTVGADPAFYSNETHVPLSLVFIASTASCASLAHIRQRAEPDMSLELAIGANALSTANYR